MLNGHTPRRVQVSFDIRSLFDTRSLVDTRSLFDIRCLFGIRSLCDIRSLFVIRSLFDIVPLMLNCVFFQRSFVGLFCRSLFLEKISQRVHVCFIISFDIRSLFELICLF